MRHRLYGGVRGSLCKEALYSIQEFIGHAYRQIDQINRRVILKQVIPHSEKVFSLFNPFTEWISKGKAGVPVELGLRVSISTDQQGFILGHKTMMQEQDVDVAIAIITNINLFITCEAMPLDLYFSPVLKVHA